MSVVTEDESRRGKQVRANFRKHIFPSWSLMSCVCMLLEMVLICSLCQYFCEATSLAASLLIFLGSISYCICLSIVNLSGHSINELGKNPQVEGVSKPMEERGGASLGGAGGE